MTVSAAVMKVDKMMIEPRLLQGYDFLKLTRLSLLQFYISQVKTISTEKHMTNNLKLSDNDLWQISAQMNAIKWRALGRTLGLDEDILLNLEHAHKSAGVRECAYQMLLEWKVNYTMILYKVVVQCTPIRLLFQHLYCSI